MTVVFNRPYQFVPPDNSNVWPWFIQRLRLVDRYLKKKDGIVDYECRHLEPVQECIDRGNGMIWAPNHSRYSDPLIMGWPARKLKVNVHAIASWHLFNEGWFDAFAIRKMGGFSINREGTDRQSLETGIDTLVKAERPLILFPEGTTSRTNDELTPLLDGVAFIARTAARRKAKNDSGNVVLVPLVIKYLCLEDINDWAPVQIDKLEKALGWTRPSRLSIRERTVKLSEALLSLKEIQHLGHSKSGNLSERRDTLIDQLLETWENRLEITPDASDVRTRVRSIRSLVAARHFGDGDYANRPSFEPHPDLADAVTAVDLAQELFTYPDNYLAEGEATDTRLLETIQRMQELLFGKPDVTMPVKAVIEFGEPIPVPAGRAGKGDEDPLMLQYRETMESMIKRLSGEANLLSP